MVTVSEARDIIFHHLFPASMVSVDLSVATGKVLAERVLADRDFPPFDRVAMDGIAISHAEWMKGRRAFTIEGTQAAGEPAKKLSDVRHCMEAMTGAMLPGGCDTIIRYEDIEINGDTATILTEAVSRRQHVHQRGVDATRGEALLEPGVKISPSEVALIAAVGKKTVRVHAFPKVAIISTGDELVEVDTVPEPHQIRRSNAWALQSALQAMGGEGKCFHLADEKSAMEKSLREMVGLYDVLILSGGVSKGKFDFVPDVLAGIGIAKLFHQVSQRPGKPFWFGRSKEGTTVFALPGNPVSTFTCFYHYVRPWIWQSLGLPVVVHFATLAADISFPPPLTYFIPVAVENAAGRLLAYPAPGGGSGDFASLKNASGFLELPLEKSDFKAGEVYPYVAFRG
jgi:molybdopterin molybdotransferase